MRTGIWLGLVALALQILLSPLLSSRALAMALDPLADAAICASFTGSDGKASPVPMKQSGYCAECCLLQCATGAVPGLPAAAPTIMPPPGPRLSRPAPCAPRLTRGPPPRSLPATGPPATLA